MISPELLALIGLGDDTPKHYDIVLKEDCYFIPALGNASRIRIEPQSSLAAQIRLATGELDKALDIIEEEIDEPSIESDIKWGAKYQNDGIE